MNDITGRVHIQEKVSSRAYATLMSAFYLPLVFMLGGLILRSVAFEFRSKATSSLWLWDTTLTALRRFDNGNK